MADVTLLAGMNLQLIEDEASANPMTLAELTARMGDFLAGAYSAVVFELDAEPVAYALFRAEGEDTFLRQLFVSRGQRRLGIGRAAVAILLNEYFPPKCRVTVDVLIGNQPARHFWESVGFQPYALTLERPATAERSA